MHRSLLILRAAIHGVLIVTFLLVSLRTPTAAHSRDNTLLPSTVQQLMERMSSLEKVGQLFLITFQGNDVSASSDIARLIQQMRIGGVALSPMYNNFINHSGAPTQLIQLTNRLQLLALTPPDEQVPSALSTSYTPIPLFIALNEEGDGPPYTALWGGLPPLPSAMALGATWNPTYAEQIGEIVGTTLSALGVNMLLGPSLDVLDRPALTSASTIGTRSFGGDPFWVSRFGQAYIRGVHRGAQGRVLTVAKHFPGLGSADRDPYKDLPTIQKSLETLRSVDLVPFFSVAAWRADDPLATTDALMVSHVRYRGFQGNIRQLSRPLSLDAQNLPAILNLPELAAWRAAGGLLLSQELGVPSTRKFYDPNLETFPAKRIAQEAFLAGNDLLYLARFDLNDNWSAQVANIEATVLFFRDRYDADPTFRARVDESVARILARKLSLYETFSPQQVLRDKNRFPEIADQGYSIAAKIAQEATTLVYPSAAEISGRLPSPPLLNETILIITDERLLQECERCVPHYEIEPTALERLILKLYGPEATAQVTPERVHSLTFEALKKALLTDPGTRVLFRTSPSISSPGMQIPAAAQGSAMITMAPSSPLSTPSAPTVAANIQLIHEADWLIFAMLDVDPTRYPNSDALKLFLREWPEILEGKKIIVFAFNAPYFLDATEVSQLSAYYGLYSKTTPFLEAAVRLLFQEFQPRGASPVDINATGYQIIEVTRPDPSQVIGLEIVAESEKVKGTRLPTLTPSPIAPEITPLPVKLNLRVGDMLTLRTSRIMDRNGRPVPDGTPVEFRLLDVAQSLEARLLATTVDGVATTNFELERSGTWQVTAVSEPAQRSVRLIVTVPEQGPIEVGIDRPYTTTAATQATPTTNAAVIPTREIVPAPTAQETSPEDISTTIPRRKTVNAFDLLLSVLMLGLASALTFQVATSRRLMLSESLTRSLAGYALGLAGYILYALGLLPLERITWASQALAAGLPHEMFPVGTSLLFFGVGWWMAANPHVRRMIERILS
ncbi:MAG: glycoside hydrolase family 3 N-terminal domain-containing protein [Anaerolineae bacterium]